MAVLRNLPRFRRARQAIKEINALRHRSRDEIYADQLRRLNRLWQHARQHVPYYRQLKQQLKLPSQFENLEEFRSRVPCLEKEEVRHNPHSFLSERHAAGAWHRTGGSTGVPTQVFWSSSAHLRNLQLRYAWLARHGVDLFDRQALFWGHAGSFSPGWRGRWARFKQPILDRLRNRCRFSAYQIDIPSLDLALQVMKKKHIQLLYGYSSLVWLLANRAVQTGVTFDAVKMVVLTGEAAMPHYAATITNAFSAPCRIEYGSVECGNLAFENEQRQLEIQEHARLIETVPNRFGGHDVVVTVLDNPCCPLLRYRIGDVTSAPVEFPVQGSAYLTNIEGRNNEYLVSSNGQWVHANAVKHAMENVLSVSRFQALQQSDGTLILTVQRDPSLPSLDERQIIDQLRPLLGTFKISIKQRDQIEGNLAGKHCWVRSEMKLSPEMAATDRSSPSPTQ